MKPRVQQLHQSGAVDGQNLIWDATAGIWAPSWVGQTWREILGYPGTLSVQAGSSQLPIDSDCVIVSVVARVKTAPTGASVLVDLNKNGTTVFTTQANRPTIAAAANVSSVVTSMDVTALAAGDYLSVDIDQIGSTIAGSDLVVAVRLREAT
jgi:hypothetical protein